MTFLLILLLLFAWAPSSGSGRVRSISCFAVLLAFLPFLVGRLPVWRAPRGSAGFINVLKLAVVAFLAMPLHKESARPIVLVGTLLGLAFVLEMCTA